MHHRRRASYVLASALTSVFDSSLCVGTDDSVGHRCAGDQFPTGRAFRCGLAYGLTDEQDPDGELLFSGPRAIFRVGSHYRLGSSGAISNSLLDTGSQVYYFTYADSQVWNLPAAGLDGTNTQRSAASPAARKRISPTPRIYMTRLNNASFSAGQINLIA